MNTQLDSVLKYLQSIQGDLVGIVIPVIITAAVSLFSQFVTSAVSMLQDIIKYNHQQFKCMQEIYPSLKICLQNMRFFSEATKKSCPNLFDKGMSTSLKHYYEEIEDDQKFRSEHQDEVTEIDSFLNYMKRYIQEVSNFHQLFRNNTFPAVPLLHPVLRKRVYKMLSSLQYWSGILSRIGNPSMNAEVFFDEIQKYKLDKDIIEEYITIIDKWYQAY